MIQPIFSTGLYVSSVNTIDNQHLIQQGKIKQYSHGNNVVSNMGGFQSFPFKGNDEFPQLSDELIRHAHLYCDSMGMIDRELTIDGMWMNINTEGNWNRYHNHLGNNSIISGVYYASAPEGCGNIEFMHPDSCFGAIFNNRAKEPFTQYNSGLWTVTPEVGKIVLFPSSLNHMVLPNQTNQDRVSLAFNFNFIPK